MDKKIKLIPVVIFVIIAGISFLFSCVFPTVTPPPDLFAPINIKLTILDENGNETLISPNMVDRVEFEGNKIVFKEENNDLKLPPIELSESRAKEVKVTLKDGKTIILPLRPPQNYKEKSLTSIKYDAGLITDIESKNIVEVEILNRDLSEKERIEQKKLGGVIFHINRPLLYGKKIIKAWIDYHPIPVQTIGITDNGDLILDALFFNKYVQPYSKFRFIVEIASGKLVIYTIRIDKKLDLKFNTPSQSGAIIPVTFEKPTKIELNLDINIKIEEEEKPVDLNYQPPKEEPVKPPDETNPVIQPTATPLIQAEPLDTTFEFIAVEEWDSVSKEISINVNDITNITIDDVPVAKSNISMEGKKIRIKKTEPDGKKVFGIYLRDGRKIFIIPIIPDNINDWTTNKRPLDYKVKLIKDIKTSKFISAEVFLDNTEDTLVEKMLAKKSIKLLIKHPELYKKPVRKAWIDSTRIPREAVYIGKTGNLWLDVFYAKYVKEKSKIFLLIETEQNNLKVHQYQFIKAVTIPEQPPELSQVVIKSFTLNKAIELKFNIDIKEFTPYSQTDRYEPTENEIETR